MQSSFECPHCGHTETYDVSEVYLDDGAFVLCCKCYGTITIPTEWAQVENNDSTEDVSEEVLSVLEEGESVIIINEEHPWSGQIALICDTKHKFVRIELFGKKLWVPNEWVKHYESNDPTE